MAAMAQPLQPSQEPQQQQSPAMSAQDGSSTRSRRPVQREASSLSIVFSASWVRLSAPIGEGAFSRVYEGVYRNPDTQEESVVAIKILKKSMLKRRSDCLRFIKEAKIMTKINHRHIAACYGIGKYEDDDPSNPGSLFIVQELIRGGNLLHKVYKQMLNRTKCVYTSQEALQWMMDVASGMAYLHAVQEGKPMIIHRDLKLENIMLAPTSQGVAAKLVDFGLHKVIDDRIKKVVKRVISEANLGTRLGRLRAQHEDASLDFNLDDELEAALAEQHAMVVASSVKPGVGPAACSPLGTGSSTGGAAAGAARPTSLGSSMGGSSAGGVGGSLLSSSGAVAVGGVGVVALSASPINAHGLVGTMGVMGAGLPGPPPLRAPGRRASQLSLESSGLSMSAMPEEVDEEEQAIREAQEQQRQQQQQQQQQGGPKSGSMAYASRSPLGTAMSGGNLHGSEAQQVQVQVQQAGVSPSGSCGGSAASQQGGGGGGGGGGVLPAAGAQGVNPAVAKIRAPVKKQSSMQKLMAKMKEIRLKVTGKDQPQSNNPSTGSNPTTTTTALPPGGTSPSNLSRAASVTSTTTPPPGGNASAGGGPSTPPPTEASSTLTPQRSTNLLTPSPSPGQGQPLVQQPGTADAAAAAAAIAAEEKRQRNMQLLDRMVAAQSGATLGVGAGAGVNGGGGASSSVMDAQGLVESEAMGRAQPKQRAPPRRAVTMMNEIRYNLTEAVGSWAYMAPEVVLGQPYNEKVDVFSFGVILFEVLFRKLMLVDEIKNDPRKDAQAYAERVARGFRPEIPKHWPELLHELIAACWAQDPHQRPNFAAVVDALNELARENVVGKLDLRLWSNSTRASAFI